MKKNVTLICDLQFGSCGKGLIAGYLAERDQPDLIVTAWSPNAGHTYINADGQTFIHTMLANGIVSPKLRHVLIGPGSVVHMENLFDEVTLARDMGYLQDVTILIHPHAAIVTQGHRDEEARTLNHIGSTQKGSGAALIQKIQRGQVKSNVAKYIDTNDVCESWNAAFVSGYLDNEYRNEIDGPLCWDVDGCIVKIAGFSQYNDIIDKAEHIQVEGSQGFSIGINNGFYPYTTSRECTPAQIMVDCNVPIRKLTTIVGCMRTFPIRVANRYDSKGNLTGYSGPSYRDQNEITWEKLDVTPEKTTVTKLVRRVFDFSLEQTVQAIRMCGPDEIFLNFCNYIKDYRDVQKLITRINTIKQDLINNSTFPVIRYLGEGPTSNSVYDISHIETRVEWVKSRQRIES